MARSIYPKILWRVVFVTRDHGNDGHFDNLIHFTCHNDTQKEQFPKLVIYCGKKLHLQMQTERIKTKYDWT